MSARGFGSVFMVASCAGAALGCYLVSLHVASERAALERTENRIAAVKRDIRLLETEIGTRGRLAQLERWNVKVLALSAPSADQFVDGGFALARLIRPEPKPAIEAPVVLAAAPAEGTAVQVRPERDAAEAAAAPAEDLIHSASLRVPDRQLPSEAKTSRKISGDKKDFAEKKAVTGARTASRVDPLAPLPADAADRKRKDTGTTR